MCRQEQELAQMAAMFPDLSQDRISKIFSGQVGHMSIDKLVEIRSALKLKVSIQTRRSWA
jgi:predicted XRE-type DNA-binding protein